MMIKVLASEGISEYPFSSIQFATTATINMMGIIMMIRFKNATSFSTHMMLLVYHILGLHTSLNSHGTVGRILDILRNGLVVPMKGFDRCADLLEASRSLLDDSC